MTQHTLRLGTAAEVLGLQACTTATVDAQLVDRAGWTVRCTPWRRTVVQPLACGGSMFRKLRSSKPRDAWREWSNLEELDRLGFLVPGPIFLAVRGQDSVVAMLGVQGRPLDALLSEALAAGDHEALGKYLVEVVAVLVRRLHGLGWCYRDLYWNHFFAESLAVDGGEPALIDVERAFRPRWRWERWRVKDLAGLLAAWPEVEWRRPGLALRFLRSYLDGDRLAARAMFSKVVQKAARIRAHSPRYG